MTWRISSRSKRAAKAARTRSGKYHAHVKAEKSSSLTKRNAPKKVL